MVIRKGREAISGVDVSVNHRPLLVEACFRAVILSVTIYKCTIALMATELNYSAAGT